ncbi:hypothetical protein [Streptomyces sp. TRM68367]|uniref:hypothetical protein n=1 Tax=Streptomyces sp. TRM68367 TaxID=2758415 RepID=UPI00165CEA01|nr:hypothetical protein [Streptomyces sp. TRM68367]MBC9730820.1 hypothetical protein [Streptomyces sp. TRM68367]
MSSVPRLLPWTTEDGKACLLSTEGDEHSYVSRLADQVEAVQLKMGTELLGHVTAVLDDRKASPAELRFVVSRLSEALRDSLRVAASRGARLGMPDTDGSDEDDQSASDVEAFPELPAEAFG